MLIIISLGLPKRGRGIHGDWYISCKVKDISRRITHELDEKLHLLPYPVLAAAHVGDGGTAQPVGVVEMV